ncbi:MAG: hypothetical protein EXS14_07650 [Planctomycetes bacterium]|nr:hypothetical protein [Planctomycetota bacterium]
MDPFSGWFAFSLFAAERLAACACALHAVYRKRRNPTSAASWMVVCVFIPVLGSFAYVTLGAERVQRRVLRRRRARAEQRSAEQAALVPAMPAEAVAENALAVRAGLAGLGGNPFLSGNSLCLHVDGDEAYPAMLQAINAAQRSVVMASYIFDSRRCTGSGADPMGLAFLEALTSAARRGVRVRMLYDAVGSSGTRSRFFEPLRAAGGRVQEFFPRLQAWRLNFRDHRKMLLVDDRTGFVSSLNIGARHLRNGPCFSSHDLCVEIGGPVLEQLRLAYEREWLFATDEEAEQEVVALPPNAGTHAVQVLEGGPFHTDPVFLTSLVSAIHHSRNEILLCTPYFIPDATLRMALRTAVNRGVRLTLLVPERCDSPLVNKARMTELRPLARELGVTVLIVPGPMQHIKAAILDGEVALLGSSNLDNRSLFLNFELDIAVASRDFAQQLRKTLEVDLARARELPTTRAPLLTLFMERVAALFAPLL